MSEKLKPCPFCGSDDLEMEGSIMSSYYVRCRKCGAGGGVMFPDNEENAVKMWNARAYENE